MGGVRGKNYIFHDRNAHGKYTEPHTESHKHRLSVSHAWMISCTEPHVQPQPSPTLPLPFLIWAVLFPRCSPALSCILSSPAFPCSPSLSAQSSSPSRLSHSYQVCKIARMGVCVCMWRGASFCFDSRQRMVSNVVPSAYQRECLQASVCVFNEWMF